MQPDLKYIKAVPGDYKLLTETAITSKKTLGYDGLMELWKQDLRASKNYILRNKFFKLFDKEKFIGFFGLKMNENNEIEIDHFLASSR